MGFSRKENVDNQELINELRSRISKLETDLKVKDCDLQKANKELDKKTGVEQALADKDSALKRIESSMPEMLGEHKKILAKYQKEVKYLKTEKDDLENKLKNKKSIDVNSQKNVSQLEIKDLKSKVKEIQLVKDEEIKSLKEDLKKAKMEKKRKEIKARDEDLKKKLQIKDDELKQQLLHKSEQIRQSLDKKDVEVKNRLLASELDFKKIIKCKEEEFDEKLLEFEKIFKRKDEEMLQTKSLMNDKDSEIKMLKLQHKSGADLDIKMAEFEKK